MEKKMIFALFMVFVIMCSGAAWAAIPPYISFQGRLTDTSVSPPVAVTTATDVWFEIFDVDTAGTEIWAGTKKITPDSDGIFNVILGYDITPTIGDLSNLDFDKQYWVEVRIGTATTGTRQRLTSVPYAFTAKNLKGGWVDAIGDSAVSGTANPETAIGVYGFSNKGSGVYGSSGTNIGVQGYSISGTAVLGNASGTGMLAAISGKNSADSGGGPGIRGESKSGYGVYGISTGSGAGSAGVYAENTNATPGPAFELGSGYIKIPTGEATLTPPPPITAYIIDAIAGTVTNNSTTGWHIINNKYVDTGSLILVTPQEDYFETGVKIHSGNFEIYIPAGKKVAFLVINQ